MRSFVSTILVVMILVCQGLSATHAHFGHPMEMTLHSARPHFHAHGAHSHGADRDTADDGRHQQPLVPAFNEDPFSQHDSDAFYCVDSVKCSLKRSNFKATSHSSLKHEDLGALRLLLPEAIPALAGRTVSPCQWSTARIPQYLRHLSIRC